VNHFVVESPVFRHPDGVRVGTARVYVATEERAKQLASELPERTWRAMSDSDRDTEAAKLAGARKVT